jgi:aminoglycoside/choline kinase family phosphotransferase
MLAPTMFTKQMIDFQKATFGNAYNSVSLLQDQAERMAYLALEKMPWFPEEGKKVLDEWVVMYKKGREEFKVTAIQNYASVKSLLGETIAEQPAAI